jgi:hypothetical protein
MTDSSMLERYRQPLLRHARGSGLSVDLLIDRSGAIETFYAPFEHVNEKARIVFVGITPGLQQAENAIEKAASELRGGAADSAALKSAKAFASFSGGMRTNLVDCLNGIGLNRPLGVRSCAEVFDPESDLAHFTSVLRYPTFLSGSNYSGSPDISRTPFLQASVDRWFATEVDQLADAWWVPLGPTPTGVLDRLATLGRLSRSRILAGLPHPSGANAERINYFLGRKERDKLSAKTDPNKIEQAKATLLRQVAAIG